MSEWEETSYLVQPSFHSSARSTEAGQVKWLSQGHTELPGGRQTELLIRTPSVED